MTKRLGVLEKDWQQRVVDLAELCGWRYAHFRPLRTKYGWRTPQSGDPGFPDLVLVRPPRVIFAELKAGTNSPEAAQQDWLDDLGKVPGVESYCWRLADWDHVLELLR